MSLFVSSNVHTLKRSLEAEGRFNVVAWNRLIGYSRSRYILLLIANTAYFLFFIATVKYLEMHRWFSFQEIIVFCYLFIFALLPSTAMFHHFVRMEKKAFLYTNGETCRGKMLYILDMSKFNPRNPLAPIPSMFQEPRDLSYTFTVKGRAFDGIDHRERPALKEISRFCNGDAVYILYQADNPSVSCLKLETLQEIFNLRAASARI